MSFEAHPTAIIEDTSTIGDGTRIGPYAIIEPGARIGTDCEISAHAIIKKNVVMGDRCRVAEHAVLGGDPQDLAFHPEINSQVVIGNDNVFREFVTLHRGTGEGTETRVGNQNFLMAGAHLGHNVSIGDHCILANNVLLAGHVRFGSQIVVGGATVFHQFVRVGDLAMIQGLSKFGQDILPGAMAAEYNGIAGLNHVGLRRAGFEKAARESIREVYELFFHRGFSPKQFLEAVADRELPAPAAQVRAFVQAGSKRGYCRFIRASEFKGRGKE